MGWIMLMHVDTELMCSQKRRQRGRKQAPQGGAGGEEGQYPISSIWGHLQSHGQCQALP